MCKHTHYGVVDGRIVYASRLHITFPSTSITYNLSSLCFSYPVPHHAHFWQDSTSGTPVTMRVDPKGFYLCWVDQNNEIDLLDIATIRDVRTGQFAKKPRVNIPHKLLCLPSRRRITYRRRSTSSTRNSHHHISEMGFCVCAVRCVANVWAKSSVNLLGDGETARETYN